MFIESEMEHSVETIYHSEEHVILENREVAKNVEQW